jgi:hypothetical protein
LDTIGKKILHGVFGLILGVFAGFAFACRYYQTNLLVPSIIGGILFGIIAFFSTDAFWNSLRRD